MEFLGTWEQIYNPAFKVVEFDHFKSEAGLHTFVLSVSDWIEKTEAIGLFVKRGKYGGTYAHKDIDKMEKKGCFGSPFSVFYQFMNCFCIYCDTRLK